jgi:hypothetical protein
MMQAIFTACVVISGLAIFAVIASIFIAMCSTSSGWKERAALLISVFAVAPSLLFAVSGIYAKGRERLVPWHPTTQGLLDVGAAWLLVGPVLFMASASLAKLKEASRLINGCRVMLVIGWIAASSAVVEACVYT